MPAWRGCSSLLQHDDQVPGDQLTNDRDPGQPVGEARVVAGNDVQDLAFGLPPGPVDPRLDGDGEQGLTETVLRLAAVPPSIPLPGPTPSQEVPRRGLVAAPGAIPDGVRQED